MRAFIRCVTEWLFGQPWRCLDCGTEDDEHYTSIGRGMHVTVFCNRCYDRASMPFRLVGYKTWWIKADCQTPWEVIRAAVETEKPQVQVDSRKQALARIYAEPDSWCGFVLIDGEYRLVPRLHESVLEAWDEVDAFNRLM